VAVVCVDEHGLLADIERLLQTRLEREVIPGYAPDPTIRPEPISRGRTQGKPGKSASRRRRPTSGNSGKATNGRRQARGKKARAARG